MRHGVHVFILTLGLFATGTSAIGYSFAHEIQVPLRASAPISKSPAVVLNISTMICTAFHAYEQECAHNTAEQKMCTPLEAYLSDVGVDTDKITQTQTDAVLYCKLIYPKISLSNN